MFIGLAGHWGVVCAKSLEYRSWPRLLCLSRGLHGLCFLIFDKCSRGNGIIRGNERIAVVIGIAAIVVIAVLAIYLMGVGSWDYSPPHGTLNAERIADNAVIFTIEDDLWGADGPVKFDNCAIDLRINGTRIGPNDYRIGGGEWYVRTTRGCGYLNASVFADGLVCYIIVLDDADSDGNVSEGDTISLLSTEPLKPLTQYSVFFVTELRSSWSPGTFNGEYST